MIPKTIKPPDVAFNPLSSASAPVSTDPLISGSFCIYLTKIEAKLEEAFGSLLTVEKTTSSEIAGRLSCYQQCTWSI